MGILDYDLELAKQAIRKAPGLLNEYIGRLNSTLQDKFAMNEMDQKRSMRGLDAMAGGDLKASKQQLDKAITDKMINVGLDTNPGAVGQIVWHGSPHKFNKFDMSKIGTGEGAQAYGHGLYTAEAKDVGTEYMRKLAGSDKGMAGSIAANALRGRDADSAIEHLSGNLRGTPENQKMVQDAINLIKSGEANNGYLYKVDIPDEAVARFLDWDKPLSQQEHVQRAMLNQDDAWRQYASQLDPESRLIAEDMVIGKKPVHDNSAQYWNALYAKHPNLDHNEIHDTRWRINPDVSDGDWLHSVLSGNAAVGSGVRGGGGADLYNSFGGGDAAAQKLRELGIPGIRYLDGGSRGAGQGSSNFVLFDDQMPRILEVNGQATGLQPWAKGEWRGLLGE